MFVRPCLFGFRFASVNWIYGLCGFPALTVYVSLVLAIGPEAHGRIVDGVDCSFFLANKPTSIRWLSRYRRVDQVKAGKILSKWQKLSLAEYRNFYKQNPDALVFVQVPPNGSEIRGVLGDVELVEVSEDYAILSIRDRKNRIHAVDMAQQDLVVYVAPTNISQEAAFIERFSEESFFYVDLDRLREAAESWHESIAKTAEYANLHDLLERSIEARQIRTAKTIYGKLSDIFLRGYGVSFYIWSATSGLRIFGIGTESFLMQHSSNFYVGFLTLGAIHSSLAKLSPQKRRVALMATTLFMGTLNAFLELNLGFEQRWLIGGASDWPDFHSGVLGISTYLGLVTVIEGIIKRQGASTPEPLK